MSGTMINRWYVWRVEALHNGKWDRVWDYTTDKQGAEAIRKERENAVLDGGVAPEFRLSEVEVTEVRITTPLDTTRPGSLEEYFDE